METIGILGGFGPDATIELEHRILVEARRVLPPRFNQGYPPVVTVHLRHPPVLLGGNGRALEPLKIDPRVLEAAARLGTWADFLVIAANTPHLFVEEIAAAAGRDVLSMVDLVVEELARRDVRAVGLLGLGIPQAYVDRFELEGIEATTAPAEARAGMDEAILRMLEGITREEHREAARVAVRSLRDAGAPVTILGCTEIPLLLGEAAHAPDLVDPARLLARAAVLRAVG